VGFREGWAKMGGCCFANQKESRYLIYGNPSKLLFYNKIKFIGGSKLRIDWGFLDRIFDILCYIILAKVVIAG